MAHVGEAELPKASSRAEGISATNVVCCSATDIEVQHHDRDSLRLLVPLLTKIEVAT